MADRRGREITDDGLVTVGLPTFNRRAAAVRAACSVIEQSHRPLRLVISDNASDDGTAGDLDRLDPGSVDLSLFVNPSNIGPSANFARVRDESSGEYFMWLGDDDWLDETYIDECVVELSGDHRVVMVAGVCRYHGDDGDWREAPLVDLRQDSAAERVLGYFRSVTTNGVFYGLTRRSALAALPPVPNVMGGDWLHVARLAFLGQIRTLSHVEVHRSVGGATQRLAHVARHQQLGWLSRNAPQLALAWVAVADIGWRSTVYAPLGRLARLVLALRSGGIILGRFLPGAAAKFVRLQWERARHLRPSDPSHQRHATVEP